MFIIVEERSWSESLKWNEFLIILRYHWVQYKKRSPSLRMANVVQFLLSSNIKNTINKGWDVVKTDFFPTKLPEIIVCFAIWV